MIPLKAKSVKRLIEQAAKEVQSDSWDTLRQILNNPSNYHHWYILVVEREFARRRELDGE